MRPMLRFSLLALALACCGCARQPAAEVASDPRVVGDRISFPKGSAQLTALRTEPAGQDAATSTRLFGRLTWNDDVTARVFTPFAGRVRRVLVDAGQNVTRGQPLAEVESPDFGQAQADARAAESALRLAESNRARLHDLFDHGAAARKDVEAADAEAARAGAERARARSRLASCGAAADSVTGLFLLRSPITGAVVERNLTPGQEIRPDQMLANAPQLFAPLFVISDPSRLWIQIDAPEQEATVLRPGSPFRFASTADPGQWFEGRIDHVAEAIDPVTHTVRGRGAVANPRRLLKAEMYVTVELPGRATAAASVPARAVFLKGDRHYVFVQDSPGTFTRREVRVGSEEDTRVLVYGGVASGQEVVTDGCILLQQLLD